MMGDKKFEAQGVRRSVQGTERQGQSSENQSFDGFPGMRLRRLRTSSSLREMVKESVLHTKRLIWPLFVAEDVSAQGPIASMPGVERFSLEGAVAACAQAFELGIRAVMIFGVPLHKDETGQEVLRDDGVVCRLMSLLRARVPELILIADVCVCSYMSHGHCGFLREDGVIDNDKTCELLGRIACCYAHAGAHIVAPSGMMDGQVNAIRKAMDREGFQDTLIMSYAAKFSSHLYGPFREAGDCAPRGGSRATYQMDPSNAREALREMEQDAREGADFLMVKPAVNFLDILSCAYNRFDLPLVAYHVSGEYAMIKAAAEKGWIQERGVVQEILTSIHRAGASLIITYYALDCARWLSEEK